MARPPTLRKLLVHSTSLLKSCVQTVTTDPSCVGYRLFIMDCNESARGARLGHYGRFIRIIKYAVFRSVSLSANSLILLHH